MKTRVSSSALCAVAATAVQVLGASHAARANDGIFPAAPAAKASIDFDGRGFMINGRRTFIASGSLHYARVPRALWRDRLLRFKRAGFNTVQTYVFWDFNEPQEGKIDFTGDGDLDAFLKLAKSLDMYAVVRVGPYVCAEWESGGYPIWLRFKPGVKVREDNAEFEKYVDRFWDKLIPIVAKNQINRGGNVVMVQLENEHPNGWGTEMPNAYFRHLREKAIALGVEVPYFFSGLHHGSDPAGDRPWDSAGRENPWYTTEFWTGWYSDYGPMKPDRLRHFDRATWKILAYGGNGFNDYMLHGGSNFAYWNNNEDAASYDYGCGVGQAGDLRPIYYKQKRAAWFARSFQEILENSTNATDEFKGAAQNPSVHVSARRSASGSILFLDNPTNEEQTTTVLLGHTDQAASPTVTLEPGEFVPVVSDFVLRPGISLVRSTSRILGIVTQGDTTTIVAHGKSGAPLDLRFHTDQAAMVLSGGAIHQAGGNMIDVSGSIANGDPVQIEFAAGGHKVRVLAMTSDLADHTWFVDAGGQPYIVSGPAYLSDATLVGGKLQITAETPWQQGAAQKVTAYGEGLAAIPLRAGSPPAPHSSQLALTAWQTRRAAEPVRADLNDSAWFTTADPQPMGADGDITADAWYRTTLSVPASGQYTLRVGSMRDRTSAWLDGLKVANTQIRGNGITLDLTAGKHRLAVFAAHDGRDKLFPYVGPIDKIDAKGLTGPAVLQRTEGSVAISGWRWVKAANANEETPPPADAPGWADYAAASDVFDRRAGDAWFIAKLPAQSVAGTGALLHFEGVDDRATVFINGRNVMRHDGWSEAFDVPTDGLLHDTGDNVVAILVHNNDGIGGISGPVGLVKIAFSKTVSGWKLRGGPGDPMVATGWRPLSGAGIAEPTFFRTSFRAPAITEIGRHPIWRVITSGLSHGSVWVNGHNLGRYPEKVAVDGLYIPEPWLKPGDNSLVIYDEEGNLPTAVRITAEAAASRDIAQFVSKG
jgi:beta-galactosidase